MEKERNSKGHESDKKKSLKRDILNYKDYIALSVALLQTGLLPLILLILTLFLIGLFLRALTV